MFTANKLNTVAATVFYQHKSRMGMANKIILSAMLLLLFTGLAPAQKPGCKKVKALSYVIIETGKNSFGYDIYQNGKMIIHQNSIPAIRSNRGFTSKQKAAKVASLVITKIKKGEMPPAVTEEEIKKLGAL